MIKNMGFADRLIRVLIALAVGGLYITGVISGTIAIVAVAVGAVLLLTSLVNFCPLYAILGIRTCRLPEEK